MKSGSAPTLVKKEKCHQKNLAITLSQQNIISPSFFSIFSQFGAIQKLDSRCMVHDFKFSKILFSM